jgi:hypothetical protein
MIITSQQRAIVEAFLQDYHPAYDCLANHTPLLEEIKRGGSLREGEVYHSASNNAIILEIAFQTTKQRLAVNAEHTNALQQFFAEGYADTMASRDILLQHFGEFAGSIVEAFREVAKKYNLPLSAAAQHQAAITARRKAILKEIANGKTQYTAIAAHNGAQRVYEVSELESESLETLENVLELVRAFRQARSRTPSEARKELRDHQTVTQDFPALPQVWRGIPLTRENLHRLDSEASRMLIRVYGETNFLNRFNGVA